MPPEREPEWMRYAGFVGSGDSRASQSVDAVVDTGVLIAEGPGWFLRRFDVTRALQFLAMSRTRSCWSIDRHMILTGVPLVIHQH
jgi:hypothetical protein